MSDGDGVSSDGELRCDESVAPDLTPFVDSGVRHLQLTHRVKRAPGLAAFLDTCATLRRLSVHHPHVLRPPPTRAAVRVLEIGAPSLDRLDFLSGFPELERLVLPLRGARVTDFSDVRHVPRLRHLVAHGHLAGTLKPLRALAHLEAYVAPQAKALASLDGLDGCPELRQVDASHSRVASLSALAGAHELRALNVRGTKVPSLEPIHGRLALETLFAERTKLRAIDGIAEGLPALRVLWLHTTKVLDLSPLRGLASLLELDLGGLETRDFSVLADLPSLEHVDLSRTPFSDLAILESLPHLVTARLTETKVRESDPRAQKLHRQLRERHGRDAGLRFDARSGRPQIGDDRAACAQGDLPYEPRGA